MEGKENVTKSNETQSKIRQATWSAEKIAADQAVICLKLIGQEVDTSFPDQIKSTVKLKEMQSWIKLRFSQIAQLFVSDMLTFNFNITKSCEGLQDISPSSLSPCCSWQRQTYDHTKHQMKASLIKISNHSRCYWRQHVLLQSHFVIFIIDHGPPGSELHLISL